MKQIYHYQCRTVLEFLKDYDNYNKYNLSPIYQRENLWKEKERAYFIDSIFWGKPIPSIYTTYNSKDNRHDIIDGKQRLQSLVSFFHNEFTLPENTGDNSIYGRIRGKTYNEIYAMAENDDEIRVMLDDFHSYQLPIFVVEKATSLEEDIDIFDRLNCGQAHNETEKLHGLFCNTELYLSIQNVLHNDLHMLTHEYLNLSSARMEDLRFCINIYLFVLLKQNIDGNEQTVKERFGTYCKDYNSNEFKEVENSIKTILAYWNELGYKKGNPIYNQTNIYTIFTFLYYCLNHNVPYSKDLKEKIKEFFNKVRGKEDTEYIKLYTQYRNNSKSSRDKRLKALLVYTGLRSSDSFKNDFCLN